MARLKKASIVLCTLCAICIYMWLHKSFFDKQQRFNTSNKSYRTNKLVNNKAKMFPSGSYGTGILHHYPTANCSKTKPPFFPLNGTGVTVDINSVFDNNHLSNFCTTERDLVAIVPVYSAPGNVARRRAIRETVGKMCVQRKCKLLFIVGVSMDNKTVVKINEEFLDAGDVLVIDKVDTYRDLNNKVVAMLDWLIERCPKPKYVIHIIDDLFPNIDMILEQMDSIKEKRYILGQIYKGTRPLRRPGSKWHILVDEYPYEEYPWYLVGVGYAFLNEDSGILRHWVHAVEYCWIEDVWFTGHVRRGAGFEPIALRRNYLNILAKDGIRNVTSTWNKLSGIHGISVEQFYIIHDQIKSRG